MTSRLGFEYYDDSFGDVVREDDAYAMSFPANYSVSRWLNTYVELSVNTRDSTTRA